MADQGGMSRNAAWRVAAMAMAVSTLSSPVRAAVDVSSTSGQPTYAYPIAVPPGINGHAPALALSFGGGAEQSTVGLGWSLTGVPLITRCSATFKTDGAVRRPTLSATDKLCLDGRRLIPTDANGTPAALSMTSNDAEALASGQFREFRTEGSPYVRIRAYGIAGGVESGPKYFRVWSNDGRQYIYGDAPSSANGSGGVFANATVMASQLKSEATPRAVMWRLARSIDVAGNTIDYKYTNVPQTSPLGSKVDDAGTPGWESLLKEIQYAGNKVILEYVDKALPGVPETRNNPTADLGDIGESVFAGTKMIDSKNVSSITTYINSPNVDALGTIAGAVPVLTLKLAYDVGSIEVRLVSSDGEVAAPGATPQTLKNTGRTRLQSIEKCAGGAASAKCLKPVEFKYSVGSGRNYKLVDSGEMALTDALVPRNGVKYGAITADFDGDGRTDLLRWSSNPSENLLLLSQGNGAFQRRTAAETGLSQALMSAACHQTQLIDFDRDMMVDLLVYSATGKGIDGTTDCNGEASYFMRNLGGGRFQKVALQNVDLARIRATQTTESSNGDALFRVAEGREFYVGDLTGDGIPDIITTKLPAASWLSRSPAPDVCFGVDCTQVYRGNGNGSFTRIDTGTLRNESFYDFSVVNNGGMPASGPMLRDINGDGKADLIVGSRYSPMLRLMPNVLLSRGDGAFDTTSFATQCAVEGLGLGLCRLGMLDYNGDGYVDLIAPSYQVGIVNKLYLGGVNGQNWPEVKSFNLSLWYYQILENDGSTLVPIDVNQDGKDDLLRLGSLRSTGGPRVQNVLWLSQGDGQFTVDGGFFYTFADKMMQSPDGDVSTFIGNFTGLGGVEFVIGSTSGNEMWVKANRGLPDQLVEVIDENGLVTAIEHVSLAKAQRQGDAFGERYVSDRGTVAASNGPLYDVPPPSQMSVVSKVRRPTGIGLGSIEESYLYGGLKYDVVNRVNAGFRVVKRQTPGADGTPLTTKTTFQQQWPYTGTVAMEERYAGQLLDPAPAAPLLRSTSLYCDAADSAGAIAAAVAARKNCATVPVLRRPFSPWSQTTAADLQGNELPMVTREVTVNAEAAPLTAKETVSQGGEQFVTLATTTYAAENRACASADDCKWIFNRPETVATRKTVPDTLPSVSVGTSPDAASLDGGDLSAQAAVSPGALEFAPTVNGQTTAVKPVTVKNVGRTVLAITGVTTEGDFLVASNACGDVAPGAGCTVGVSFRPTAAGARTGTLRVSSNGRSSPDSIALSGEGSGSPLTIPGVDFGDVRVAQELKKTITVLNRSADVVALSVSGSSVSGTGFRLASTTCGATLAGNGQCTVELGFSPAVRGAASGVFNVIGQTAALSGKGVQGIAELSPASTSFDQQHLGTDSQAQTLTLKNTGDAALAVSQVVATGDFNVLSNECVTLPVGMSTCNVQVRFKPTATGTRTGQLSVMSDGVTSPVSVALDGAGVNLGLATDVSTIDFGTVQAGQTAQRTVTLTNPGSVAATGVTIAPSDWFTLVGSTCGSTIAAGGSCSFTAEFKPSSAGTSNGLVIISALGKEVRVIATGQALFPATSLTDKPLFDMDVGGSLPVEFIFKNEGIGPVTLQVPASPVTGPSVAGVAVFTYNASKSTCVNGVYAPQASCKVTVDYKTPSMQSYTGGLTLQVARWNNLSVYDDMVRSLRVQGVGGTLEPTTAVVAFGNLAAGQTADSAEIRVGNSGNKDAGPLQFKNLPSGFQLINDSCTGTTLVKGNESLTCGFKVRFTPSAAQGQDYGGSLVLTDNRTATTSFLLSGKGVKASATMTSLAFGNVPVGAAPEQVAVLSNTGNQDLSLTVPGGSSVAGADFSFVSTTCGATVPVGGSCQVRVRFTPSSNAVRSGTVSVNVAGLDPISGTLSGTAQRTVLAISPSQIAMADTQVQEVRDSGAVTLTNSGNLTATSVSIGVPSGFSIIGSNCGATLGAGASCTFQVRFSPTQAIGYGGSASISAASPAVIPSWSVSGTGRNPSGNLQGLAFGLVQIHSTAQGNAVLTNTGVGGLSVNPDYAVSGNRFIHRGYTNCPSVLGAGQTCVVGVDFAPNGVGGYSGTVAVNTGVGQLSAGLSGTGRGAILGLSPGALNFGNQAAGTTSGAQQVTVRNSGTGSSGTISISVPGGFAKPYDNCTGRALSNSESDYCTFGIAFNPQSPVSYSGSVAVSDGIAAASVSVSGSAQRAVLAISPSQIAMADTQVQEVRDSGTVTLTNSGNLTATSVSIGVPSGFSIIGSNCGATLGAGASCTFQVRFSPTQAIGYGGSASLSADSPAVVSSWSVSGTGRNPSGNLQGLAFGLVQVHSTSQGNAVLSNTGVGGLSVSPDYAVSGNRFIHRGYTNCPSVLGAGQTCVVGVDFAPNGVGGYSGTVAVNTGVGQLSAGLSGTGRGAIFGPSPGALNFGNQNVGTTSGAQQVTVWNSGTGSSGTINVGIPGGFTKPYDNCTGRALSNSESDYCTFGIAFNPQSPVGHGGSVTISDGIAAASVSVSGTGLQPVPALTISPSGTIDFGSVAGESVKQLTYTVSNSGGAASGLSFSFTTGTSSRGFFGRSGGTCGSTLAGGSSCTLVLTYMANCGQSGSNSGVMTVAATSMQTFSRTMSANTVRVTCQ